MNSRYYNPEWGRFINADGQIGEPGTLLSHNMFAYCMNNPINMEDPDGYLPNWAKIAIGVGVIVGLGVLTVATAGTGTALACVALGAFEGALAGAAAGAVTGAAIGGAIGYATGGWEGARQGAIDGAADGFMTVAITGAITGGATSSNCFVAGTQVAAVVGSIPIEDIKPGDLVYAYDEETGEVGTKPVVQTFVHETDELVHVKVDGQTIDCTPEHPFYVPQKGWTAAANLRAGDKLLLQDGKVVIVEVVQHEILESPVKVYNFEVADWHTYFVSDSHILVHNTCKITGKSHGSATHKAKIDARVNEMALSDKYSEIFVNKSLKTAGLNGSERPDIIGKRLNGSFDIIEYASKSQYSGRAMYNLIRKVGVMRGRIGNGLVETIW